MAINTLFNESLRIINLGSKSFVEDYERQKVAYVNLEWQPPAGGDRKLLGALKQVLKHADRIAAANQLATARIKESEARLVGLKSAKEVIPDMKERMILHAGPHIAWSDMAEPMKGAIVGAILFEGWAKTAEDAWKLAAGGSIAYEPCHEHQAVGPMAGIVSPSMPVHIVYDEVHDHYAYCSVNEGLGKVLRFGAYDESVLSRLRWIRDCFAPVLQEAIELTGGVDIKSIVAQALQMGDECHNRNKAATSMFLNQITTSVMKTKADPDTKIQVIDFIHKNEHYFLNLSMAFSKVSLDAARNIADSSLCIVMARNGVEFGIQLAGCENQWFTAEANYVNGLYFAGYSQEDATRDLGDSAITETRGIGGFAMGCSPAIVQFVGGSVRDALQYSQQMHEICETKNDTFTVPALDFYPTALGIDCIKVVESGTLPIINTGIAHKQAGIGQVGAGLTTPPAACFEQALLALAQRLEEHQ